MGTAPAALGSPHFSPPLPSPPSNLDSLQTALRHLALPILPILLVSVLRLRPAPPRPAYVCASKEYLQSLSARRTTLCLFLATPLTAPV